MSRHVRSRQHWSTILEDESVMVVGPVVGRQASDEQPQQEQSPPQTQDITPDEQGAAGAPEDEGTELVIDLEELEKPITGGEGGDVPEVMGYTCANPEHIEMPKTGKGKPLV